MSKPCHSGILPLAYPLSSSIPDDAITGECVKKRAVCAAGAGRTFDAPSCDTPPRPVTTGGNFPPAGIPVIPDSSDTSAHNDWLAFTLTPPEGCDLHWLFPQLKTVFGTSQMIQKPGRRFNGYENTFELTGRDGNLLGLLGIGGEHQRGTIHVSLNAGCCALVPNWKNAADWGESLNARITRVDVAHDDFEGKAVNIQIAKEWNEAGLFGTGGRLPKARLIDDLGSGDGKTFYIGKRGNGKYCRIYEKGKQLGDPSSPWVRVEVELKGDKKRRIPWDVLTRPGHYLAGAYPCLAFLAAVQEKIRTITKTVTISYKRAVENARQSVGKLVNVMLQANFGDAFAVINELRRDGVPRRLENYTDFLPQIFDGGGNAALVN